ncbi:hypothetical protein ACFO3U_00310 [Flavobacterium ponti]|uniref:Pectate lyase superfamily protein domain-containing protein n=1 Tax=Flavobacterium ponti TaxID=665133 RepID=A0ABV9NZW2_9FLAO
MKKFIILFFISYFSFSQSPQGINYQSIAYSSNGNIIINSNVGVKASILDISQTGSVIYSEEHTILTNSNGVYSLVIGQGSVLTGVFSDIQWGIGSKYLKVELDPTGGTNYIASGISQFMSVPYALYSDNVNPSKSIINIANFQSLRETIGDSNGNVVYVRGYSSDADGGGGHFTWNSNSSDVDNDGTTIKPSNYNSNGRWIRNVDSSEINVKWFGALGSGNDYTDNINKIIDTYKNDFLKVKVIFPKGIYKLKEIDIPTGFTFSAEQRVSHSFTNEVGVIIKPVTGSNYIFKIGNPNLPANNTNSKNSCIEYFTIDGDYQNVPTLEAAIKVYGEAHRIYNNSINFCYKHALMGKISVSRIENNFIQGLYGLNNINFNDYYGAFHLTDSSDNWILNNEIGVSNNYIIKKEKAVSFYANEFHNNFISNNIIENGGTGAIISFATHNKFSNNRYEFSGTNGLVLINNALSNFVSESFLGNGWFENEMYSDLVIGKYGNVPENQTSTLVFISPVFLTANNGANPVNILPKYHITNYCTNVGDWKTKIISPMFLPGAAQYKFALPSNGDNLAISPYILD